MTAEKLILLIFAFKEIRMKQNKINLLLAALLIFAAAFAKVITHPHTFDPIIGMALFGGAVIKDRRLAFALPLLAMFLSDVILEMSKIDAGFYGWSQLINYGVLILITLVGSLMKKINVVNVIGLSLASSVIFFILSNLGFFLIDNPIYKLYPNTFDGLAVCYAKAIPFFKWYIDLAFSVILFGSYYLMTNYVIKTKQVAA